MLPNAFKQLKYYKLCSTLLEEIFVGKVFRDCSPNAKSEFVFADVTIPQISLELIFADADTVKKESGKQCSCLKRFVGMIINMMINNIIIIAIIKIIY